MREHHTHGFKRSRIPRGYSGAGSSQLTLLIANMPSFRSSTLIIILYYCSMKVSRSKQGRRDRARAQRRREVASAVFSPTALERLSWAGVGWTLVDIPRGSSYLRQSKADLVKSRLAKRSKTLFQHASGEFFLRVILRPYSHCLHRRRERQATCVGPRQHSLLWWCRVSGRARHRPVRGDIPRPRRN